MKQIKIFVDTDGTEVNAWLKKHKWDYTILDIKQSIAAYPSRNSIMVIYEVHSDDNEDMIKNFIGGAINNV